MIVAALVIETLQLIRWRDQGWTIRHFGILAHPYLGHVTHSEHCAVAHAPSGRPVAVSTTTDGAVQALTTRELEQ